MENTTKTNDETTREILHLLYVEINNLESSKYRLLGLLHSATTEPMRLRIRQVADAIQAALAEINN